MLAGSEVLFILEHNSRLYGQAVKKDKEDVL